MSEDPETADAAAVQRGEDERLAALSTWPAADRLWAPQPGPQTAFVRSPAFETMYGGARGGGKTDAALGEFLHHAIRYGEAARGLLVRRNRVALEPTLERAKAIYGPAGARWEASRHRFRFKGGAVLYLRPLATDADAEKYQGHDYTRVYVEELTQFPSARPIEKLKATLRSAAGVACRFRATCNPGGPGHGWVRSRYVDPGANVMIEENGLSRVFIPARLADNPALIASDPLYVERLKLSGSPAQVRAWLDGDWDTAEGAFFDTWRGANIVLPFVIPDYWLRMRSFDWGYAAPFSVGWWAVVSDPTPVVTQAGTLIAPRGAMIRYREWYGRGARPGEGARLDAEAVARGILEREQGDRVQIGVADPSIFAENGGPSIGERMARAGVRFARADNTRVPRAGALSGWDQMRARIAGDGVTPMLFVFETCRDFIRTVPGMVHDPQHPEDIDSSGEDHIADETRYACLARRWIPSGPAPETAEDRWARLRREERRGTWMTM